MCLVLLAYRVHPEYPLVLAANRDEHYARPTLAAAPWPEAPQVIAGRDGQEGGTWMGVTRSGRWAALTNFRDPAEFQRPAPSRGHLVGDFLRGGATPEAYLAELLPRARAYNGFNLLLADPASLYWYSNRDGEPRLLGPGIYGVSNHLLDTPWPKVVRGKAALAGVLEGPAAPAPDRLLEILLDRTYAADHELPESGVGAERERALSPLFIATPDYGTRSSTALLVDRRGTVLLVERTYTPASDGYSEARHEFTT